MPYHWLNGWRRPNAKAHVFIAIPTYGDIKSGGVASLLSASSDLMAHNISGDVAILNGDCHVDDARNFLVALFLQQTEASHLMFIDADVTYSSSSIRQLIEHDVDFAAGVYPFKNDNEDYPVILENPQNPQFDERGLVRAKAVPGGFMCIRRHVLQRLFDKNAKKGVWPAKSDASLGLAEIFHRSMEKGRSRRSGDYEFCDQVRRAGYKIWIAPNLRFGHIGDKIWNGCLQDYWLRQSGQYERQATEALQKPKLEMEDFRVIAKAFGNEPFAADPVLLSVLYDTVQSMDRPKVLETGSGVSTAIILAAGGIPVSLESEPLWGSKTQRLLRMAGMDETCVHYTPIVFKEGIGAWYDAKHLDGQFDMLFCDGPRRDEAGMRARICGVMPEALKSIRAMVVDDTDYSDGQNTLKRFSEFGFVFDLHNGPRRQFAVGVRP